MTFDENGLPLDDNGRPMGGPGMDSAGPSGSTLDQIAAALAASGAPQGGDIPPPPGGSFPPPDLGNPSNQLIDPALLDHFAPQPEIQMDPEFMGRGAPPAGGGWDGGPPPIAVPAPLPVAPVQPGPGPGSGKAGRAPTKPGPGAAPGPLKYGDVAGAEARAGAAAQGVESGAHDALDAQMMAAAVHAQQADAARQEHLKQQALADTAFQQTRATAREESDAAVAANMRAIDKKASEEPNKARFFENTNVLGKILWTLSVAFGAKAQMTAPGFENVGLKMLQQEVQADVASQKARQEREMEALKMRGGRLDQNLATKLADMKSDFEMTTERYTAIEKAALEKAQGPGTADWKAAHMKIAQSAKEAAAAGAVKQAERTYGEREHSISRAEAAASQQREFRHQEQMAVIKARADLAKETADREAKAGENRPITMSPEASGATVVDKQGRLIPARVDDTGRPVAPGHYPLPKDPAARALVQTISDNAQKKAAALQRVSAALGSDTGLDILASNDPELRSAMIDLGYATAKENDPRGIVTSPDFVYGVTQATGADLDSMMGKLKALSVGPGREKLKEFIDKEVDRMPVTVGRQLSQHLNSSEPGYENAKVLWHPLDLEAPATHAQTPDEARALWDLPAEKPSVLQTVEDYHRAKEGGTLPPMTPEHDKVVQTFTKTVAHLPPDKVMEYTVSAAKRVKGDTAAEFALNEAATEAYNRNSQALQDFKESYAPSAINRVPATGTPEGVREAIDRASKYGGLTLNLKDIEAALGTLPK